MASGQGYIALDGDTYTWWPPLYANALALLEILPFSGELSLARIFHAALFGANLVLAVTLARQMLDSPRLAALGALLAFFSIPLLSSTDALLSEPLFNLFILAVLICLVRFLKTGEALAGVFAAVFAALVPLTRYAGVTVVMVGCLLLLVYPRNAFASSQVYSPDPLRQRGRAYFATLWGNGGRFFQAFVFGLVASLPTGLWIGRNHLMAGTFTGPRTPSTVSLVENLRRTAATISGWYLPGAVAPLGLALALILLVGFLAARLRRQGRAALRPFARPAFVVPAAFVLVYIVQLVVSLSIVENAAIGDRLLAPVFVPLTYLLLFAFWKLRPRLAQGWVHQAASLSLMVLLLIAPLGFWSQTLHSPLSAYDARFSIYSFRDSPLIQSLSDLKFDPGRDVYSNCPRCLYVFANIHPVWQFNDTPRYRSLSADYGPFYIVWFDEVPPDEMPSGARYPLPDVAAILGQPAVIQTVAQTEDGAVFFVSP